MITIHPSTVAQVLSSWLCWPSGQRLVLVSVKRETKARDKPFLQHPGECRTQQQWAIVSLGNPISLPFINEWLPLFLCLHLTRCRQWQVDTEAETERFCATLSLSLSLWVNLVQGRSGCCCCFLLTLLAISAFRSNLTKQNNSKKIPPPPPLPLVA